MSVTLAVDKEERTGGQSEVMYFIFADGTFVCAYTEANTAINRAEDILRGGKAKNIVLWNRTTSNRLRSIHITKLRSIQTNKRRLIFNETTNINYNSPYKA